MSDFEVKKGQRVEIATKASQDSDLELILTFSSGDSVALTSKEAVTDAWGLLSFSLDAHAGKQVRKINLSVKSSEPSNQFEWFLGKFSLLEGKAQKVEAIKALTVNEVTFDDENMYAGVRLSWSPAEGANHYEVYKVFEDGSRNFLGATYNPGFFINGIEREGELLKTTFEAIGVGLQGNIGGGAQAAITWPDNSLPTAGFRASKTILAPGEMVTLYSASSMNTESVSWKLVGASIEKAEGTETSVSYASEGHYTVEVTAKNAKGEHTLVEEAYIYVTGEALETLNNLSHNKPVEASSFIHAGEQPAFAFNGSVANKWCAVGPAPHHITVDLEEVMLVSEVYVAHAEAGGVGALMNTERYSIEVSEDGVNFTEVVHVKKNTQGITVDTFKATPARFVRFTAIKPTQSPDSAARIYEVRVGGFPYLDKYPLISMGKPAEASSYVNDGEAPAFALDGKLDSKWCAVGDAPHTITIDLESVYEIGEVYIAHAEAGGEPADMNTKAYAIELSLDGEAFTKVHQVDNNTSAETLDVLKEAKARFVRITILSPTQGSDTAARIYEIKVGGK